MEIEHSDIITIELKFLTTFLMGLKYLLFQSLSYEVFLSLLIDLPKNNEAKTYLDI